MTGAAAVAGAFAPTPGTPRRVAVLVSGGGSNLQALLDHQAALGDRAPYAVSLVVSGRPDAGALTRADAAGVPRAVLADPADGAALLDLLDAQRIDLVVLAGYLKLVPAEVTGRFRGRMLNVHPALLPAFGGPGMYGARVHRAVLAAGVRVSGATVHFVDEAYDRGAIVAQWPVPVHASDDAATLAARVLGAEHALLPRAVAALADGLVILGDDGRVQARPADPGAAPVADCFALGGAPERVAAITTLLGLTHLLA